MSAYNAELFQPYILTLVSRPSSAVSTDFQKRDLKNYS